MFIMVASVSVAGCSSHTTMTVGKIPEDNVSESVSRSKSTNPTITAQEARKLAAEYGEQARRAAGEITEARDRAKAECEIAVYRDAGNFPGQIREGGNV